METSRRRGRVEESASQVEKSAQLGGWLVSSSWLATGFVMARWRLAWWLDGLLTARHGSDVDELAELAT